MIDFTSTMAEQIQLVNTKRTSIPRFDQAELERLVLGSEEEEPRDVVLFGEGNFTFSIALASLRKNRSQGMTVTRYERVTADKPLPQFNDVKIQAIENCIHNGGGGRNDDGTPWGLELNAERRVENIQAVLAVRGDFPNPWRAGVDATHIPPDLVVADKVVWFQCPWAHPSDDIPALIRNFMTEMANKQNEGDYLIIGIANHGKYIDKYKLPRILGDDGQGGEVINGYSFMGGDNELIKKILGHGYKHHSEGPVDIHDFIFRTHVTLVFKRENQAQAQDQDQDQDLPQIAKLKLNEEGGGEGEGGEDKEEEKKKKKKIKK